MREREVRSASCASAMMRCWKSHSSQASGGGRGVGVTRPGGAGRRGATCAYAGCGGRGLSGRRRLLPNVCSDAVGQDGVQPELNR